MGRFAGLLVLAVLVLLGKVSAFPMGPVELAFAQDTKKNRAPAKKAPVKSNSVASELNEAQRRIDRLEAQISEMQSMIGALQTLVQKGVSQSSLRASPPVHSREPLRKRIQGNRIQGNHIQGNRVQDQDLNLGTAERVTSEPQLSTDGWGADIETSLDSRPQNRVPGADLPLEGQAPESRVALNGVLSRKLYDTGYNYLMASNYSSAEATFRSFLRNYPQDQLSGNAQYWLGETFFARGNYRKAAGEFLKGYKTYKTSQKAPDNLLKLGMSLHRLGQSEAACQTYTELQSKYKSLPGHIGRRLSQEQGKASCR